MKKSILISFGTFLALASMAQVNSPNVVASGGGFFTAGTFTNSFTIGEMTAVTTSTTGSFILTQGFQQPDDNLNSVVENNQFIGFSAYPNPSNGQIAFDYNLTSNGKVSVEVFDALGQLVYSSNEEKLAGIQHDQLNLSVFADGLYSVRYSILTNAGNYDSFVSRITLTK